MKVATLIEKRQPLWRELESLCDEFGRKVVGKIPADKVEKFSTLYRAACADLALAESYQLPPNTIDYLHRLVARAHNQLYRSRKFDRSAWYKKIFIDTPKLIFNDPCVHIATVLFWGLFLAAAYLAYNDSVWPGFAEDVADQEVLDNMTDMYSSFEDFGFGTNSARTGAYVLNNPTIGLFCFVTMLFVLPGLVTLSYNAIFLGTVFGYMFRPDAAEAGINFKSFVTAHGPFELTAVVLCGGAGLKIGLSWMMTNGLSRKDSLIRTAREALPIAMCAVVLFILAALIEGFVSPMTERYMPWAVKGGVAVLSSAMLMFYFVVLGYPRGDEEEEIEEPWRGHEI